MHVHRNDTHPEVPVEKEKEVLKIATEGFKHLHSHVNARETLSTERMHSSKENDPRPCVVRCKTKSQCISVFHLFSRKITRLSHQTLKMHFIVWSPKSSQQRLQEVPRGRYETSAPQKLTTFPPSVVFHCVQSSMVP